MKKTLLKLSMLFFVIASIAQAPAIQWQKTFGGSSHEEALNMETTTDNGAIVVGMTASNDGDVLGFLGGFDYWILKLDDNGTIQWQKTLGSSNGDDRANCVLQTNDGGYIVSGYSDSVTGDIDVNKGGYDYLVIKLSANGSIEWKKNLGGTNTEIAKSIIKTSDNGYLVSGISNSFNGDITGNHGGNDYWVVKLATNGDIQWQKSLGGTSDEYAFKAIETSDNSFVIGGYTFSSNGDVSMNHGDLDIWIVKLNSTGNLIWEKSIGGSALDCFADIQLTNDGGYILTGQTLSHDGDAVANTEMMNSWVIKLNSTATIEWQQYYKNYGCNSGMGIIQNIDNSYVLLGRKENDAGDGYPYYGQNDFWVSKLSPTGAVLWHNTLGGSSYEFQYALRHSLDNGYYLCGSSASTDGDITSYHGAADYWVIKLSPEQLSTPDFEQSHLIAYPNPTNGLLQFQLPNQMLIDKIIITDVTGKIILEKTANGNQINTESFSIGTYFVQAFSGLNKYQAKFIKE